MTKGKVIGVNGNMVTAVVDGEVSLNEVCYIIVGEKRLKSEVIRVQGNEVQMQVFEMTRGISIDDPVEFTDERLSVASISNNGFLPTTITSCPVKTSVCFNSKLSSTV